NRKHLLATNAMESRVASLIMVLRLPGVMGSHRAMTRLTANPDRRHSRYIRVATFLIIFAQPCVVAGSAHGIPGHSPACPMAPFAWLAIFLAKDVEPIRTPRVENQFAGLQPASGGRDKKLPQRLNAQHALRDERL